MTRSDQRPRVVLIGLGTTSATALLGLLDSFEVVALVRDPSGTDDPATVLAQERGVPLHNETTIGSITGMLLDLRPDCAVVSSYHRILPAETVNICPFVNVHYAPLPAYRGRATVNWAIINGEPSAAISIHELVPGLDAGNILYQQHVPIGPTTTVTELYTELNDLQRENIAAAVKRLLHGDGGDPQDEDAASYACTRLPADGLIDWSRSTTSIDRLVRGLTPPFPGAFTHLGLRRLWIDEASPAFPDRRFVGRVPGRVVAVSRSAGTVDVLTDDSVLRLKRVRIEDEPATAAADLIRSVKTTLGLQLDDVVQRLRQLEV